MQKVIADGVPFWKDKLNVLYSFEPDKKNLIVLGTYVNESCKLKDNWESLYEEYLSNYRKNLKNRDRKENKLK